MTTLAEPRAASSPRGPAGAPAAAGGRIRPLRIGGVVLLLLGWVVLIGAVHITQGTADLGLADVLAWATGRADAATAAVIESSRLPRVAAGLVVGVALGLAGTAMQSFTRNVLASPDTLAVNQGAFFLLTATATLGLPITLLGDLGVAFAGGIGAAAVALLLAGSAYGTVRLILAGITLGLILSALTTALIVMHPMESRGLFAWSAGTLSQAGFGSIVRMAPLVALAGAALMLLSRRLDLLMLGDDEAASLGVPVRGTRLQVLLVSVLLSAAAVTLVGPIGYVGLVAPTLVRMLAGVVPGLHRHRVLLPVAALAGVALVLTADVVIRALVGSQRAVGVPTGVTTSVIGGAFLIVLALRLRAAGVTAAGGDQLDVRGTGTRRFTVVLVGCLALTVAVVVVATLVGDRMLLPGDLVVWASGDAGPIVSGVMSTRVPRVTAALLAGVALAVAGAVTQAVTRNPLADPTVIGISGGASLAGMVAVVLLGAGFWGIAGASALGAVLAGIVVFGLAARGGFATDRLLLVGVGLGVATAALTTTVIVSIDPFNQALALTWLSGSTYGRSFAHLVPLAIGVLLLVPLVTAAARRLDLLSVDEDTPVLLGLDVPRSRLWLLLATVLLTGTAVAAIGPVAFVGLVAPHAARSLVGRRHGFAIPVAALLGGTVVVLGDLLGRSVIAPTQLPAGLLTAILGAPYFLWLMYRARRLRPA